MVKQSLVMLSWLMSSAAQAAVVINPVPAPITSGIRVGLTLVAQVPASGDPAVDGFRSRLQSIRTAPDGSGRLFALDTRGMITVVGRDGGTPRTWFDIRTAVADFSNASNPGQTGLMSVAFHPNFAGDAARPGYDVFYTIDTSRPSGRATLSGNGPGVDHDNVVHEFRVADPKAATASITAQREVLRIAQPLSDHGPGTIAFNNAAAAGSADYGKLYIGLGDGGGVGDPNGNAQDPRSPFGKILRIDPAVGPQGQAYTVPADNPRTGAPGALGEVWASGLRNPQHFSWDANTGRMLIADIGQSRLEEINVGVAGANYGWPAREGTFARGGSGDPNVYDSPANGGAFTDPIAQYDHEEIQRSGAFGLAAISGVFAYTGAAVPELAGMTVLSDLVSGRLFYFDPLSAGGAEPALLRELGLSFGGTDTTFAQLAGNPLLGGRADLRLGSDGDGELYLLSKGLGDIYRLGSLTAVPEPATWTMLIAGVGLVGAAMRRRRQAIAAIAT